MSVAAQRKQFDTLLIFNVFIFQSNFTGSSMSSCQNNPSGHGEHSLYLKVALSHKSSRCSALRRGVLCKQGAGENPAAFQRFKKFPCSNHEHE